MTSLTFPVPILANTTPGGVRTVNLTLSNPGPTGTTMLGVRKTAALRIVDNDVSLAFSAPTYSVKEGAGLATIAVELSGVNATPVVVNWTTANGSATAGHRLRYGGEPTPPRGALTFPPGGTATTVRTKTFTVRILQDPNIEATETVNLTLSVPPGSAGQLVSGRESAVLSIVDDDIGGTIQFSAATYTVGEGASDAPATIVLTRTGGTGGGATVFYATSGGTGVAGTDYTPTSGTVTFNAGQTSVTFPVTVRANATPGGVRTVNLDLSSPGPNPGAPSTPPTTKLGTRASAVLRIVDNDLSLAFSAPTYSVKESAGLATITVELVGVNVTPVTVGWAASNGTATAGSDYGTPATLANPTPPLPSGTLTFLPGGTPTTVRTRTFTVRVLQDRTIEPAETVNLTLSAPTGGGQLVPGRDYRGAVDHGGRPRRRDAVLGGHVHRRGGGRQRGDRDQPHRQHRRWRHGRLRHERRHRYSGHGLHGDHGHRDLRRRADLADVPGARRRHADARRRPDRQPDAVESGAESWVPSSPTTKLGTRSTAVLKIIDNNLSLAFSAPSYTVRENLTLATITVELTGVNATPVTVTGRPATARRRPVPTTASATLAHAAVRRR